jgi:PAS domain S-box-containing protein
VRELRRLIEIRGSRGLAAAAEAMQTGRGKALMDSVRRQAGAMEDLEQARLAERASIAEQSKNVALTTGALGGILSILAVIWLTLIARASLRDRAATATVIYDQKESFRTTLASIGDAVITTDAGGHVTFINPVAEALTGWTRDDAVGQPLERVFRIFNEGDREPAANPAERALYEGLIVGLAHHTILLARDDYEWPIDASAAPIRGEDGRIGGVVLVFRDMTERRRVERALREADRRKDEFLAILSHELRNPLAPLRNALEILRAPASDGRSTLPVLEIMDRQISQLVRLVDDLVDVSRISRGVLEIRDGATDLRTILSHALETAEPLLRKAGQTVNLELPLQDPIPVNGDEARLGQAFGNLLANAAKYSRPGGRVSIIGRRVGEEAVVTIRDTGIGIPADQLEQVFDMFAQVDSSLERSHGGLGIGLTLVRRIIELHGGTVVATSEGTGKGSEFIVRIPLARAPSGVALRSA